MTNTTEQTDPADRRRPPPVPAQMSPRRLREPRHLKVRTVADAVNHAITDACAAAVTRTVEQAVTDAAARIVMPRGRHAVRPEEGA
jgi:hypothetical protein